VSPKVLNDILYQSKVQEGLNKDYKVNNLKNKDISAVCSPFKYNYIVTRTKYGR